MNKLLTMNSTIVNSFIFAIGYFVLILFWFMIFPVLNIKVTLIETILVSLGYVGACAYLVITNRSIDFFKFFSGLVFFMIAKILTPIFLYNPFVIDFLGKENVVIVEALFYLMFLLAVIIYSSDILRERQALETQELFNIKW